MFEREAREALVALSTWFMRYVSEQTETLRSLGPGDSVDSVFDRVIDVSDCVIRSTDPTTCVRLLVDFGEVLGAPPVSTASVQPRHPVDRPAALKRLPDPAPSSELSSALEQDDWQTVIEICQALKETATDEEIGRLEEIADFARVVHAISRGALAEASDAFAAAARVLGTVGQPVYRAYSVRRQMEFGFCLLAASLALDQGTESLQTPRPSTDGSWAPLLSRRPDFFRSLAAGSLSPRTHAGD